jgi:hypothetical protein
MTLGAYRTRSQKAIRSTIIMAKAFFPRNISATERSKRGTIEISVQNRYRTQPYALNVPSDT